MIEPSNNASAWAWEFVTVTSTKGNNSRKAANAAGKKVWVNKPMLRITSLPLSPFATSCA